MDAITALKTRRSIRTYDSKPIPVETLEDIVDCGRLAATAMNKQPWEFVIVTQRDTLKALAEATAHGKFIAEAGACIIAYALKSEYGLLDACAATQNMLVAAKAHGLGSCWVAGYGKEHAPAVNKILGAPDDVQLISLIAVGYSEQHPSPPKRPLTEVLHWEKF